MKQLTTYSKTYLIICKLKDPQFSCNKQQTSTNHEASFNTPLFWKKNIHPKESVTRRHNYSGGRYLPPENKHEAWNKTTFGKKVKHRPKPTIYFNNL